MSLDRPAFLKRLEPYLVQPKGDQPFGFTPEGLALIRESLAGVENSRAQLHELVGFLAEVAHYVAHDLKNPDAAQVLLDLLADNPGVKRGYVENLKKEAGERMGDVQSQFAKFGVKEGAEHDPDKPTVSLKDLAKGKGTGNVKG